MTVDWASFIFGAASAIATSTLIIISIAAVLTIRSRRYKAPPLFNKDNS